MTFSTAYAIPLACLIATATTAHTPVRVIARNQNSITRQAVVQTHGFNLASTEGRRLLDKRLRRVVALVCDGPRPDFPSVDNATENCQRAALASARHQADVLAQGSETSTAATASLAPGPVTTER